MNARTPALERLLRRAGQSIEAFGDFLIQVLDWPIPAGMVWEQDIPEWDPTALYLDPDKVGILRKIYQLNIQAEQDVGILVMEFDGKRLPIGAIRRVIERFVVKPKGKTGGGELPAWNEDRILVFCISPEDQAVHAVGIRREGEKRVLRVLSWAHNSTDGRIALIQQRGLPELRWGNHGPALTENLSSSSGFGAYRESIKSASALATRMADVARDLRAEVVELLEIEASDGPMRVLLADFRKRLLPDLTPAKFADVYAQTMVYGLLSARVTHPELFEGSSPLLGIRFSNELLDSVYARFREQSAGELDVDELGLGELAVELAKTDVEQILADFGSKDRRMDPVVYLYEQFLQQYDPRQRLDAGAFYTPLPVVQFMTKAVDHILKSTFGLALGVADPSPWSAVCQHLGIVLPDDTVPDRRFISMVDPATGTGTYLMEWIRVAKASYVQARGEKGWSSHFEEHVAVSMHAFELMLAPYAIAHLKFAIEGHAAGVDDIEPTIVLSDTLHQPPLILDTLYADEPDDPIAVEAARADELKTRERFTVVIGNPPYNREQGTGAGEQRNGGVVRYGVPGIKPLIDDLTGPMSDAGQGVHIKNLYNDYVYFWRWATWRATQELGEGPGIVAMITASSYLSGKSMSGLRAHLRTVFDDFYIVDLGGEGRGAKVEENIFDILTPVAIGIGVRRTSKPTKCNVHYVRVNGTRADKFDWLEGDFASVKFQNVAGIRLDSLAPVAGGDYSTWPTLEDLMPWSHSGVQLKRTWPIGPSSAVLRSRWEALLSASDQRHAMSATEARNPGATPAALLVPGTRLEAIEKLDAIATPEAYGHYGYRSFDRQWVIQDNRVMDRPRPDLWAVASAKQIYLTTLTSTTLGDGPVLTASPYVPDLHHFRGSYGARDTFPMWRDRAATDANLGPIVLERLRAALGEDVSVDQVFQYLYGLGGTGAFSARFGAELALAAGPVRLPITRDRALFDEVVALGRRLLGWHTWGERYAEADFPLGAAIEVAPIIGKPKGFSYDPVAETLIVGTGKIAPVSAEVWEFDVSGTKPLQKWLGYRKAEKAGRSSSPLDAITYDEWTFTEELLLVINILQHTVDVTPSASDLLERVLATDLFTAEDLT